MNLVIATMTVIVAPIFSQKVPEEDTDTDTEEDADAGLIQGFQALP